VYSVMSTRFLDFALIAFKARDSRAVGIRIGSKAFFYSEGSFPPRRGCIVKSWFGLLKFASLCALYCAEVWVLIQSS
jgi:hypothetical protein